MSAKVVGLVDLKQFLAALPANLETNVLRSAIRAGAKVVADEAIALCISSEVRASIKVSTRAERGLVTARVQTKGPGAYLAPWLEHGTDPHYITVDDDQRGGLTVRRINRKGAGHAIKIGGNFITGTIFHPGATSHPFFRPAIDHKAGEAIAEMGRYVASRLTRLAIETPAPAEDDQ